MREFDKVSNLADYANHESPDILLMRSEEGKMKKGKNEFRERLLSPLGELVYLLREKPHLLEILELIFRNPSLSNREIALRVNLSHPTVAKYLKEIAALAPTWLAASRYRVDQHNPTAQEKSA